MLLAFCITIKTFSFRGKIWARNYRLNKNIYAIKYHNTAVNMIFILTLLVLPFSCLLLTSSMYVFGGFSGVLLNDVLVYRPPSCQAFLAEEGCVNAGPGVRCVWSRGRCFPWEPSMANGSLAPAPFCPPKPGENHIQTFRFFVFLRISQTSLDQTRPKILNLALCCLSLQ